MQYLTYHKCAVCSTFDGNSIYITEGGFFMKRICAFFIVLSFIFSFSACTESSTPDYELLSKRLSAVNENYGFDYFNMFQYNGAYHTYYSICTEDDLLLSLTFDKEYNVSSVTVTAEKSKMTTDNQRKEFKSFVSAVIESFCTLSDKEKTDMQKMNFNNIDLYFSDIYESYSALRYNFIFSSNSEYIIFDCKYVQVMEDFTFD